MQQGCFYICTSLSFVFAQPFFGEARAWLIATGGCVLTDHRLIIIHVRLVCRRAFQEYYQEHLEYACPTEDIYLEWERFQWRQLSCSQLVYVHQDCHQRALSLGFSLHCKIILCVPLKLGSAFLQYNRHLTDFIHLSLSLSVCLCPSSQWMDCLFLLSFSMI